MKPPEHKLFVTGLSTCNKTEARRYFSTFGKVLAVKPMPSTGRKYLFGFVIFKEAGALELALQANVFPQLTSGTLILARAQPRPAVSKHHTAQMLASTPSRRQQRRLQYRQKHAFNASSRPCALADVVHEAPVLLDFLPPDSWSALSSCSRQLRQLVHSSTKAVTLDSWIDLMTLREGKWPHLAMVLYRQQHVVHTRVDKDFRGKLHPIASVGLSCDPHANDFTHEQVAVILSPKRKQCSAQPPTQPPSYDGVPQTALSYLQQPRWSQLRHLTLCNSKLSADGIAQLVAIDWPHLCSLNVDDNHLGASNIAQLVKGSWPQLNIFSAGRNQLGVEAMRHLVHGTWPLLKELRLFDNPLGAEALALLSQAEWTQVTTLYLWDVACDAACMRAVIQTGWSNLSNLCWSKAQISSDALAEFAGAHWPQLQELSLSENNLGTDAIAVLVTASLPRLRNLHLYQNKLTAAAAKQLAKGNWPRLATLALNENFLDDAAMFHLSHGQWPHLHSLRLQQNKITAAGIQLLLQPDWRWLMGLTFDRRSISAQTWEVLHLDPDCMPDSAELPIGGSWDVVKATRRMSGAQAIWPHLTEVSFYPHHRFEQDNARRNRLSLW